MIQKYQIRLIMIAFLLTSFSVYAERNHPEKWYQTEWCQEQSGKAEVSLEDQTRCDCVTDTHAVEVDFADNWYEAVGQSTHYSLVAKRRAGILLILESPDDRRYWERLNRLINNYDLPIDVWTIGEGADSEIAFLKGGANNNAETTSALNCNQPATLKMERSGTTFKWIIHIPCLMDYTGAFNGKTPWATFESPSEGKLLFDVREYGLVEE
jgi:hypothetical protein